MTTDLVAWLHIALAGSILCTMALLVAMFRPEAGTGLLGLMMLAVGCAFGVAHLVAGLGLLRRKAWGRWLALGLSAVQALNAPLGSVLALITVGALYKPQSLAAPAPSWLRGMGCGVGALLAGAAALPAAVTAMVALVVGLQTLMQSARGPSRAQSSAMCKLSDLPGTSEGVEESLGVRGNQVRYEGEAEGLTMVSYATQTDFDGSVRAEADDVHVQDQLFGWRHGVSFVEQAGVPFGAENGHWATGVDEPALSMDVIDGRTRLIVRIKGREPADVEELEQWFGRCFSAVKELEDDPG